MVSDLEKLATALRNLPNKECSGDPQKLADKILSDPDVQRELEAKGYARVQDEAGRTFVVRRTNAAAATVS